MNLKKNESGANAVECGVLVALVAVLILVAVIHRPVLKRDSTANAESYKKVEIWDLQWEPEGFMEGELLQVPGCLVKVKYPNPELQKIAGGKNIFLLREEPEKCCPQIILFLSPEIEIHPKALVKGEWKTGETSGHKTIYHLNVKKLVPVK